jgi:hypothetical protein
MSDSIETVVIRDPRLPQKAQYKTTQKNPDFTGYFRTSAIDAKNTANSIYNLTLPSSTNHGISRRMYVHTSGVIKITPTAGNNLGTIAKASTGGTNAFMQNTATPKFNFCLKQNMLSSITTSTIVDLQDIGVSLSQTNANTYNSAMQFYKGGETLAASFRSGSTSKKYRFTQFLNADGDPSGNFTGYSSVQTSKDIAPPASAYSQEANYVGAIGTNNAGTLTECNIPFDLYEPLQCSIFDPYTDKEQEYFYGCSRINITRTMNCVPSNFIKVVLSDYDGTNYSDDAIATALATLNITITFDQNEVMYNIITVSSESIPKLLTYKYVEYSRYSTAMSTPTTGRTQDLVKGSLQQTYKQFTSGSQTIPLPSMPSAILLMATFTQNQANIIGRPDCYLPFLNFTIQIESNSGVFQNCVGINAYDMCVKNGLCVDFKQFQGAIVLGNQVARKTNSITVVDTAEDYNEFIGQPMSLSSVPILIRAEDLPAFSHLGEPHLFSLTVTPTINYNLMSTVITGPNPATIVANKQVVGDAGLDFTFDIIAIYDSLLVIKPGEYARIEKMYLSPSDFKGAKTIERHGKHYIGGSFWSDLGDTMLGIAGAFKDGATLNIPGIVDRITGKKKGFGRLTKEELEESLRA